MNLSRSIDRYRLVAILEGISYLLLGITMPMKYSLNIPEPNYVIGMVHGLLFMAYVAMTLQAFYQYKWQKSKGFLMLLASLIPAGTFYADFKVLKPISQS